MVLVNVVVVAGQIVVLPPIVPAVGNAFTVTTATILVGPHVLETE